jgi:aspartyl-tRNA synthetase
MSLVDSMSSGAIRLHRSQLQKTTEGMLSLKMCNAWKVQDHALRGAKVGRPLHHFMTVASHRCSILLPIRTRSDHSESSH